MSYNRGQLRDLVRRRLGDLSVPYHWSDLQVNQWINDAIADYSVHFPRFLEVKIDCAVGDHQYDLPADCRTIVRVEYPKGETPPEYLDPGNRFDFGFYDRDDLFDMIPGDSLTVPQLIISDSPDSASTDIQVFYLGDHAYFDDDLDTVSVPDRHMELIMLYLRWAAFQELATTESSNPDPTSLALSTLELNAYRAQRLYLQSLDKAKQAESKSAVTGWTMDKWDRSY